MKPRVLVVDDEEPILRLFRRLLRREFTVLTETSFAMAIGVLDREEISVVIADMRMPGGGDGLGFLGAVKLYHSHVRRILHTGTVPDDIANYLDDGTVEFVWEKPAHANEILSLLRTLCGLDAV